MAIFWLIFIIIIAFIPVVYLQYLNIVKLEEKQKKSKLSQGELYEKASLGDNLTQYYYQPKILTGSIAYLIYKIIHRKK